MQARVHARATACSLKLCGTDMVFLAATVPVSSPGLVGMCFGSIQLPTSTLVLVVHNCRPVPLVLGYVCHRSSDDALQMLERETAREKNLEKAQKEAKVRARKTTIAVVAADDPHELPAAAAEAEVEAKADTSDDLAQVPDTLPPSCH